MQVVYQKRKSGIVRETFRKLCNLLGKKKMSRQISLYCTLSLRLMLRRFKHNFPIFYENYLMGNALGSSWIIRNLRCFQRHLGRLNGA